MKVDVQFLQKRPDGRYRYRRVVPKELRVTLGKDNIIIALGRDERKALKAYESANATAEKLLAAARKAARAPAPMSVTTPLDEFKAARDRLRELGLDAGWDGRADPDDLDAEARDVIAEGILKGYQRDSEGNPIDVALADRALLRALALGGREKRPQPTLEDARKLYLKDKVGDDEKKQLELARIFALVKAALGENKPLLSIKRAEAREVRDHMLDGRKPSSVERYLNVVRAAFNHAIREFDLADYMNPFMNLEVGSKDDAEPDRDKRKPFTDEQLAATRERVMLLARADLKLIWRILEGTGCRMSEVSGLRVSDVHLNHAIPHILVEWHDARRIKNAVSRRNVPLIGDALEAAKEAIKVAQGQHMLFVAYGRKKGGSAVSAALSKHVRAVVSDTKVTSHSLRHLIKDRLRIAEVSTTDQEILMGHSSGRVGEDYGGDEVRLKVAERALRKALNS